MRSFSTLITFSNQAPGTAFLHHLLLDFSVYLVELGETGQYFAMKAMEKGIMLNRNKVQR